MHFVVLFVIMTKLRSHPFIWITIYEFYRGVWMCYSVAGCVYLVVIIKRGFRLFGCVIKSTWSAIKAQVFTTLLTCLYIFKLFLSYWAFICVTCIWRWWESGVWWEAWRGRSCWQPNHYRCHVMVMHCNRYLRWYWCC